MAGSLCDDQWVAGTRAMRDREMPAIVAVDYDSVTVGGVRSFFLDAACWSAFAANLVVDQAESPGPGR